MIGLLTDAINEASENRALSNILVAEAQDRDEQLDGAGLPISTSNYTGALEAECDFDDNDDEWGDDDDDFMFDDDEEECYACDGCGADDFGDICPVCEGEGVIY